MAMALLLFPGSLILLLDAPFSWQVIFPSNFPQLAHNFSNYLVFYIDQTSGLMLLFSCLLLVIFVLGVITNGRNPESDKHFYSWFLISAGLYFAILSAGHLYMLLFFWGLTSIPLYFLASGYEENRAATAKKTLVLFGGAHGIMATGSVIIVALSGTAFINEIELTTSTTISLFAFMALLIGSLVTTGIFPFQSWIIDFGEFAPGKTSVIMPVIIQRFAGIYLLVRLTHGLFIISEGIRVMLFLLASITLFASILMILKGEQAGKRLAYIHIATGGLVLMAISTGVQAGLSATMVYLLAASSAIAAIFLMLECNSLYNNGLSHNSNITNSKYATIFDLKRILLISLAGAPSLGIFIANAFLFKGLWEQFDRASLPYMLTLPWVIVAMIATSGFFASTLLIQPHIQTIINKNKKIRRSHGLPFQLSILLFTLLAMLSGSFLFIIPSDRIALVFPVETLQAWETRHVLMGVGSAVLSWLAGIKISRILQAKGSRLFSVITFIDNPIFTDIYHLASKLVFFINRPLSRMHDGVLQTYLVWVMAALIILFLLN